VVPRPDQAAPAKMQEMAAFQAAPAQMVIQHFNNEQLREIIEQTDMYI